MLCINNMIVKFLIIANAVLLYTYNKGDIMKKILMGFGVASMAVLPIVTVVSCGISEASGHTETYNNNQYNADVLVTYDKDNNVSSIVVECDRRLSDMEVNNLLYTTIYGRDISL